MSRKSPKVICIVGPTASGKTGLSYALASHFSGEIVSADSRQVYQYLDIGSGKEGELKPNTVTGTHLSNRYPQLRYIKSIPQWLTDFAQPTGPMVSVAEYQVRAYEVVADILRRSQLPIFVGGTGLYISAVTEGYTFSLDAPRDKDNPRHAQVQKRKNNPPGWQVARYGIELDRVKLYRKIDERLELRLKQGLVEEGKELLKRGVTTDRLRQFGLEYKYLADLLEDKLSYEEFVEQLQNAIHRFARRQLTWWRHHGNVTWVKNEQEVVAKTQNFLK